MKKILNKKAFTLVEIVVAIGILAAASVGIGAIVVAVQNNSQKQFTQGDLQQQLSSVQESLKNDLLTTNAGVKYWIQDDAGSYVESDGANKNPERNKIVAMYTMDYIDNTLTKTYVKYDANEDILYKAEMSETVTFDHSKKKLLDEKPEEVADNSALDWYVYAQGITNFSMDLSKYSENQTINYNVNISHTDNNFESDNTVNVRNEIPINEATVLENYDQAVVTRPALKNRQFVYNGQEQAPKQLDVNSRYVEIRLTDPEKDRVSATNVGQYRITYHLKNAVWEDGSTDDYTLEWEIIPRALTVEWTEWTWVYDGSVHTAKYLLGNNAPADNISTLVELHNGTVGPNYGTQTASLEVKNPNYTIIENQEKEISITKGVAEFTVVPQPAGTADSPLVYNGQYQALVSPGSTTCGTIYYSLSANTGFSPEVPTAKSANGENPYIVYYYIQGSGSYADSEIKYMEVVMQRAIPAINKPVPYDSVNHVAYYNGTAQELLYFAGTTSAATSNETNLLYSLDGNTYTPEIPTGVTAAQYTIWYKSKETADFKETVPQYVEARIAKTIRPSDSFTLPQKTQGSYTGKLQPLFVPGTGTATQAASWMYRLPDGEWSTTIPEKDAAGDYEVYLKLPETADYAEYVLETPIIVTIDKAIAQYKINGQPKKLPYLTYTGQPQSLVAHGLTQDGIIQYAIGQSNAAPNKEAFSETVPQATAAGTYYVFYYIKGDKNHYDSDILLEETEIIAATPLITSHPVALTAPYNGEEQLLLIMQGIADNGTPLQYSLTGAPGTWSEVPPSAIDAGEYTIYYKVPADDNHSDSTIGTVVSTITQAETKISGPQALNGLVYDGTAQPLCVAGSTEFGEFEYSVNSKQQWSTSLPVAINAGLYDIYWRIVETDNYKGAEGKISVSISKQKLDIVPPSAPNLTYTGESQLLLDPNSGSVPDGYHFEYRFAATSSIWSSVPPMAQDADTYYLEYRVVANDDYVGGNIDTSAQEIVVTIAPATPVVVVKPTTSLVYNGSLQTLIDETQTSINIGELEYSLSQNGPYSSMAPMVDAAGTYSVYWRTAGSTNITYQQGMVPVSIAKLQIDFPVIENLQLPYNGEMQFPTVVQNISFVEMTSGSEAQSEATDMGYDIVFEIIDPSVEWINGTTDNYTVTWYITKGAILPYTPPTPTPRNYTGATQSLFTPADVDINVGTAEYRLGAFKPLGSDTWVEVPESESSWTIATPLVSEVGEYKFLYRIESHNYENVPATEILTAMNKGIIEPEVDDLTVQYNGEVQAPSIVVPTLGIIENVQDEFITNEEGETIAQKRVVIEISSDNGQTWKPYYAKNDPRYNADTCYVGAQTPGVYPLQIRISDEKGEYETYLDAAISFQITEGTATWSELPKPNTVVYNGQAQELLIDDITKTGMHFEYQIAKAHYDENEELQLDGSWSAQTRDMPTGINAGVYAVKVWAVADEYYIINQGDGAVLNKQELGILTAEIEKAQIKIKTTPYLKQELLTYTGKAQSLTLVPGTLDGDYGSCQFVYAVSYYATPGGKAEEFTTGANVTYEGATILYNNAAVEQGKPKPTKAGTYVITWWVEGNENYEQYTHFVNGMDQSSLTGKIVKIDSGAAISALNVPYSNKLQQIFIYSADIWLSTDGVSFVNDESSLYNLTHKKDVGTYSLYWKESEDGEVSGPVTAYITDNVLSKEAFQAIDKSNITQIIFTTVHNANTMSGLIDVSEAQNQGVIAWYVDNVLYITSCVPGTKIKAPADCSELFANLPNAVAIDISGLDTSATTNMSKMFYKFGSSPADKDIHFVGLATLNTSHVTNASSMFENAARNANAVYAPYLNQISFPGNANTTNWLKNFGANANIKEIGLPDETGSSTEGDNVTLIGNEVVLYAGSLKDETLIAANWTVTYNGTTLPHTQNDYMRVYTEYVGDGTYTFTGVFKSIHGYDLNLEVSSNVQAPKTSESVEAETSVEDDILTMYASSLANKDIVTGNWTVEYEGTPIPETEVVLLDALKVQVRVRGEGQYIFKGTLYDIKGETYTTSITVTVTRE